MAVSVDPDKIALMSPLICIHYLQRCLFLVKGPERVHTSVPECDKLNCFNLFFVISDNRSWTCNICGKKFVTKSYLNRHLRYHGGKHSPIQGNNCVRHLRYH